MTGEQALDALGDPRAPRLASRLAVGLRALSVGFRFAIRHPSLWPWIVLPFAVGMLLVGIAGAVAWGLATPLLAWLTGFDRGWEKAVVVVVPGLLAALVAVMTAGLAWFCLNWLAIPFHEELSQRVEHLVTGRRHEPTWAEWAGETCWGLVHGAITFVIWLLALALSFALQLVPVLGNALGLLLGSLASAILMARETMDGPMARRRFGYGRKLRTIARAPATSLAHGGWCALWMWIPIVNVAVLPFAVVGGTLLFLKLERSGLVPE